VKQPAAFRGTYADWKLVKTRAVIQVIFEVPLADADAAYDVLGGMPNSSNERWFGIAALKSPQQEAAESRQDQPQPHDPDGRREWREVQPSAQAAMRCDQPPFWAFLREEHRQRVVNSDDAATAVRRITGVNSRARFNDNHTARVAWHQLDSQFQAWQAKERVGA
jgi:hypothetical protein